MNAHAVSRFLAAVLCTSALFCVARASLPQYAIGYSVSVVNASGNRQVTRGTTRADVLERMGPPNRRLREAVWIYCRYHSNDLPQVATHGCDTVMVMFNGEIVRDLRLVNKEAVRVFATTGNTSASAVYTTTK